MDIANNTFNVKDTPNKFQKLHRFFYSPWYPLLLVIVVSLFWSVGLSTIGMSLLLLIGSISLFTNKDISPTLPLLPLLIMLTSSRDFLNGKGMYIVVGVGSIVIIALFYYLIHFKKKFKKQGLTIPFVLISIALIFGGIGSADAEIYSRGLLYVFYIGPLMFLIYSIYSSFIDIPEEIDCKKYFAQLLMTLVLVSCIQLIAEIIRLDIPLIDHFIHRELLDVGWGNRASIAIMIVMGLSTIFYLAEISEKFSLLYYCLAFFAYACLILTCGRGGILFGTIELLVLVLYVLIKGKHKKPFLLVLSVCIITAFSIIFTNLETVSTILDAVLNRGFTSSSRVNLYHEAWDLFLQYPLFGVSMGHIGPNYDVGPGCTYWFHSTVFQVMASMGLFGIVCYAIMYYKKFKICFGNKNLFNVFMTIGFAFFEIHNLVESTTFSPFPFLVTSYFYIIVMEYSNNRDKKLSK